MSRYISNHDNVLSRLYSVIQANCVGIAIGLLKFQATIFVLKVKTRSLEPWARGELSERESQIPKVLEMIRWVSGECMASWSATGCDLPNAPSIKSRDTRKALGTKVYKAGWIVIYTEVAACYIVPRDSIHACSIRIHNKRHNFGGLHGQGLKEPLR